MRTLLWISMAVLLACGGDDGGPVTLENFGERAAESFCRAATECGQFPDFSTCIETQQFGPLEQLIADAEAGLYDVDPALLERCAQTTIDDCVNEIQIDQAGIDRILDCLVELNSGNQPDGSPCNASSQCAGGICQPSDETCEDACCAGTCVTGQLNLLAEGDPCNVFQPLCDVGLYCELVDPMTFGAMCSPQVQPGGSCPQFDACTAGHWCNFPDQESPGTCDPISLAGEECDASSANRNSGCRDVTTYCDADTSVCEPRPDVGESCGEGVPCLLLAYCDGTTCQPLPREGESCTVPSQDNPSPPPCLGDLECLGGTCGFESFDDTVCTL